MAPFLHPAIAERLRSGRRELVNEHRKVTAVFVGLPRCPSTTGDAVADLQRYLAAAVRLIAHYGGHFRHVAVGDTGSVLVAFFGAPVSHEDDEERAVRCGLELLRLPGGPFRAGVGDRGRVLRRGRDRRAARVRGDRRLGQPRRPPHAVRPDDGQLLVDRATHERVRAAHRPRPARRRSPSRARRTRSTSGRCARCGSSRAGLRACGRAAAGGPRRRRSPGSGRVIERVPHGAGQVVSLTGDAGIGKSRLAAEVVRAARAAGFAVVRWRVPVARHDHQLSGVALDLA